MSFTIKCNKCGNEGTFENNDKARRNDAIDMEVGMSRDYQPYPIDIAIYCENVKCNHYIELKF